MANDAIAFSAGATSALQLALRHPGRLKRPVVISGSWPGGPAANAAPQANWLVVRSEFLVWARAFFVPPVEPWMTRVRRDFH